jgi:hypothetical protein
MRHDESRKRQNRPRKKQLSRNSVPGPFWSELNSSTSSITSKGKFSSISSEWVLL